MISPSTQHSVEPKSQPAAPLATSAAPGPRGGARPRSPQKYRSLNVRLLATTVLLMAAAAGAWYGLRSYQLKRMAAALLDRASQLESEERWDAAVSYLQRYAQLRPNEVEIHARIAQDYDRLVRTPPQMVAASRLYLRAMGYLPERNELRTRLTELLVRTGQQAAAEEQLAELKSRTLTDAEQRVTQKVAALLAVEKSRGGDTPLAVAAYEATGKALALQPGDIELAVAFADVCREQADRLGLTPEQAQQQADRVMNAMVAANEQEPLAFLRRFEYRRQRQLAGLEQDLERALELAPNHSDVLVTAGDHFLADGADSARLARAQQCFEQAVKISPRREQAHVGLGRAKLVAGDRAAAIDAWKQGLAIVGKPSVELNAHLTNAQLQDADLTAAAASLERLRDGIRELNPSLPNSGRTALRNLAMQMEARLLLARGDVNRALPILKQITAAPATGRRELALAADIEQSRILLANAYGAMECWDLAAAEFAELAASEPNSWERQIVAGETWRKAGRLDRAVESFARATQLAQEAPRAWLLLARAELERQLQTPIPQARRWDAFQQALAAAQEKLPDAWENVLISAEFLASRGVDSQPEQAIALLHESEQKFASEPEFWQGAAVAYLNLAQFGDVERARRRLRELVPDSLAPVLLEVDVLVAGKKFTEAEAALDGALATAGEKQRRPLQHRRLQLAWEAGQKQLARERLGELLSREPANFRLLRQAIELAVEFNDFAAAEKWEDQLRASEGPEGVLWRFSRASRLLAQSAGRNDQGLREIEGLLTQVRSTRPDWSPAETLLGQVAERRGNAKLAIDHYRRAVDLGDQQAAIFERLIGLLYQENRLAEAQEYLGRMGHAALAAERLEPLGILLAVQQHRGEQAVELARRALEQRPDDPMRRVWLAAVLQASGQADAALQELRVAESAAPTDARVLAALFSHHRERGDLAAAHQALDELRQRAELPPAQKAFALGQGLEVLGKRREALEQYRLAAAAAPDDVSILLRLASALSDVEIAEAETVLRRILEIDSTAGGARRMLARLLATHRGEQGWEAAQELLGDGPQQAKERGEDERLRALLLVNRRGSAESRLESCAAARKIIETLVQRAGSASAGDQLVLASIYETEGSLQRDPAKWEAARNQLQPLVNQPEPTETHLRLYITFVLRYAASELLKEHPEASPSRAALASDAGERLDRLEQLERDANRYPTLETLTLRANWLHLQDRSGEIAALVNPLVQQRVTGLKDAGQQLQWILGAAKIYLDADRAAAAEAWCRRALETDSSAVSPLATCLARQGRMTDAIGLFQAAAEKSSAGGAAGSPAAASQLALSLVNLLAENHASAADFSQTAPLFDRWLEQHAASADVLFASGLYYTIQDRADDAIRLFEEVIRLSPRHVVALNNLATLLAEQPTRRAEALTHLEQAMRVSGRQPLLLDTQGAVYLLQGDALQAARRFEEATQVDESDPRYFFHLAAAYLRLGKREAAQAAFGRARRNGLDQQVLTAGDKALQRELEQSL